MNHVHFTFQALDAGVSSYYTALCGARVAWLDIYETHPVLRPQSTLVLLRVDLTHPKCPVCLEKVLEQLNPLDILCAADL